MEYKRTIYVTANSPGEITGFLVPIVDAIHKLIDGARVVVIMLPCTFATGQEEKVARAVPGVDEVLPVKRLWRLVLRGLPYKGDALIHLGGDLTYAALLAKRWGVPTWAFQWAQRRWDRYIRGYFVKAERDVERITSLGISRDRVHVIGDLVTDSVRMALGPQAMRSTSSFVPDAPHVVFMPGSRTTEVTLLTPFFLEVAEHVRAAMPGARFSTLLSPFIDWGRIRPALDGHVDAKMGGVRGTLCRNDGRWSLVSAAGTEMALVLENTLPVLASSDFVVTIPGTKTGEAGCLGKPMLVVLPSNRMDLIPWHGLLGLLDWIPVLGRFIKYQIYKTMVDRYIHRVWGQPNLLGDRPVVPELMCFLSPMLVADKILEIFGRRPVGREPLPLRERVETPVGPYSCNGAVDSKYADMRVDLAALYAPFAGAAERAVSMVAAHLPQPPVPEPDAVAVPS